MALFFGERKKQKKHEIADTYLRIKFRKLYLEQLDRLEKNLQQENIDNNELYRLRTILEANFSLTQQKDWEQFQKIINPN